MMLGWKRRVVLTKQEDKAVTSVLCRNRAKKKSIQRDNEEGVRTRHCEADKGHLDILPRVCERGSSRSKHVHSVGHDTTAQAPNRGI